ncbi:MAG: dihydrolipoamide acetyltransferase family protein [Candidatus Methylomirabilales bacterium]
MTTEVVMPKMGYDMTEGKILRWRKQEGEEVKRGEVIAEIETGKVDIEVEAFSSGILKRILAREGEVVPVGQVIALIAAPGEAAPEIKAPAVEAAERILASPLARKLAEEHGIDLRLVKGTGPGGRITKEDIEAYLKAREAVPTVPKPEVVAPVEVAPEVEYEERPLSRMRQTIARRMAESKRTIPHFEITVDIDMAEALKLRKALNEVLEGVKITVTDLIVKAAALALKKHPELNSSYAGDKARLYKRINIGIAVALEEGLVTPVVTDCDKKPLQEIAREAHEKAERARAGKLKPEDVVQGTFTVSNLGMFDVEEFTAIINPPEAAILAVGGVEKRPVVKEGEIVISDRMKVTLGIDHRVVDGAQAARFLQTFKQLMEQPLQLLL